ncbi:uncharacterized protein LOC131693010 [Topomyia yanbarensis]|uniref:uncharacterized protein LOC131693010 n=1 Tax=Topomyia yanbarensis TaxID=2498891 RepID=UPI00273A882A|nr:uncharacterized protein LOC131693010 [Topomyia yanbarensis]XP_058836436.1 uncharacterized protein LOC131693010 [Topomyia yanbarensis]
MGGAWERLVQSVKRNLTVLQSNATPTHEVLQNALVEVENVLNSRPLTSVPLEDDESPVLTPNHFLLGSQNGLQPWVPFDDSSAALRNSWQRSQTMANRFWKLWVRDYLPTLTRKPKWLTPVKPIAVGDVVVIVDPNLRRNCWPKGRVICVKPGADGQVRWATVQTANGIYERPAVKLAVLDVGVEKNALQEDPNRIPGGVLIAPYSSASPSAPIQQININKPRPSPSRGIGTNIGHGQDSQIGRKKKSQVIR